MGALLRLLLYLGLFYIAARAAAILLRRAVSARHHRPPPRKEAKEELNRSEIEDAEWEDMDEKRPGSG
jgi:hypothetical protein